MDLRSAVVDQIHQDFEAAMKDGWLAPGGNQIMTQSEMIVCLDYNQALTPSDTAKFLDAVLSLQTSDMSGLFCRSRGNTDQEAQDDFIALVTALWMISTTRSLNAAYLIYARDRKYFGDFNRANAPWAIEADFARFPHVRAHIAWCALETPTWFQRLYWCLFMATQGILNDQHDLDTPRLTWLMYYIHDGSWLCKKASSIWYRRFMRNWGGIKNVYAKYYGPEHPLTKWAIE